MSDQPTWEEIEEYPRIFERGPAPNMDEQKTPTPFRVVVDGEVIEVEAEDAYDAIEKAQKAKEGQKRTRSKK
jgi:ACT domain-containing protein